MEDLRQQVFSLTYCVGGMDYQGIMEMPPDEREWYVRRLHQQIKQENEEIKRATAKNKGRGKTTSSRR